MSFLQEFIGAMSGKKQAETLRSIAPREPDKVEISPERTASMLGTLKDISDLQWGRYAFTRDPLYGRIDQSRIPEYVANAIACGREYAQRISQKYGTRDVAELARCMGAAVEYPRIAATQYRTLFADYTAPNKVRINQDALEHSQALLQEPAIQDVVSGLNVKAVLLAHELFHLVEDQFSQEIYTRTEKLEMPILFFKNRAPIGALGEIAAMAFAQSLTDLPYSPFLLNVFLLCAYRQQGALDLYEEICSSV